MPRVLLAGLQMEANSFARGSTTLTDFRAQTFAVGDEIHRDVVGPRSELAGAMDALAAAGCVFVPAVIAQSGPRPPLAPEVVREVVRLAVEACDRGVDGAYVLLHGSAVAPDDDDPEGTLLAALRERLGPDRPIAVSLDHHAHLTRRMLDAVDIVTAYRTCPHTDLYERGAQAGELLAATLAGAIRPVVAMARRPMITPADLHDSGRDPFRALMALADAAEADGALAAGVLPVQPWLDVPELGWKAVVTTDGDPELATRLAERMMDAAWELRHAFLTGRRPDAATALAEALDGPLPCVIGDAGDATNAGTPGDSTVLLRAALAHGGDHRIVLAVRDEAAASAAYAAGVGAEVALTLGGGPPDAYDAATPLEGRVEVVFDGELRYTHPAALGQRDRPGRSALVRRGGLQVVVHERPVRLIDPVLFEALGIDPAAADVLQAKSQVSYKAGFARVTERSIVADTPGPSSANLLTLPFRRRPRPLFPFEPDASPADA